MSIVQIALIPKLLPLFSGRADVRVAWGGRGSGKTRSFALMSAVKAYQYGKAGLRGTILCARQFQNSLEESSLSEIKHAIRAHSFLYKYFEIGEKYIRSRDGRISYSFIGLDRNIASVKSMGQILLCWVDEAEPVSERAWSTLIPTLREEGEDWNAELWVTWNPLRKNAAVEKRFRASQNPNIKKAEINWRDNPCFPQKLERDRRADLLERPDHYPHIWEGDYLNIHEGAYYARHLEETRQNGHIGPLEAEPFLPIRAFWDIGGTGARADATSIWIAQFVGKEIRVLNYYEAQGQPLASHVAWLKDNNYHEAIMILPHDGATRDRVHDVSFESALRTAGFEVEIIANQGLGAAKLRIEAVRRLFPAFRFHEANTKAGRDALAYYHEKRDKERDIGLGPEHDWSSHAADSFGLLAIAYEQPNLGNASQPPPRKRYAKHASSTTSWMAE